jgi:predicted tellurium resistance membrane protein TerC
MLAATARTRTTFWISGPEAWIALLTLTVMELVLGVDNSIFISLTSSRLPTHREQERARQIGQGMALITCSLLLAALAGAIGLNTPLFTVLGHPISRRDLVLLAGGTVLIYKVADEIHTRLQGVAEGRLQQRAGGSLASVVTQHVTLYVVFSLDSIVTAVGMANQLAVMIKARHAPLDGRQSPTKRTGSGVVVLIG